MTVGALVTQGGLLSGALEDCRIHVSCSLEYRPRIGRVGNEYEIGASQSYTIQGYLRSCLTSPLFNSLCNDGLNRYQPAV